MIVHFRVKCLPLRNNTDPGASTKLVVAGTSLLKKKKSAARITSQPIPSPQTVACQLAGYLRQGRQTQDYTVPKPFAILLHRGRGTEVYTLSEISIKGL
jgi:hypothetical protein